MPMIFSYKLLNEDIKIWEEAREILTGIGLRVNEEKTYFGHAKEGFGYLLNLRSHLRCNYNNL